MEDKEIVQIGPRLPKPADKKPTSDTIPEIVTGCLNAVAGTEDFLQMLRNVGKYDYRKKIHLSDVELTELLDKNITAQLQVTRDYYLIWEFIHRDPNVASKWDAFWKECSEEIQRFVSGEEENSDE